MSLQYKKPPIEEMNRNDVFVIVSDQRADEEGGKEPLRVGTIRNSFGMPFPLNARSDRAPAKVIKELVSECLMAAGYKILDKPAGVPQMQVKIKSFWSDGYQYNRVWAILQMSLKKDEIVSPSWKKTFESSTGVVWKIGTGPFEEGINNMLEDLKNKLLLAFRDPKFRNSFK
jgi:hypothetical protein